MSTVGRLVYAVFETPDVDAMAEYHRDVLGLRPVGGDADGAELTAGAGRGARGRGAGPARLRRRGRGEERRWGIAPPPDFL
jgi:hypothetical protein